MLAATDLIATHRCFVFPDKDTAVSVYGELMLMTETDYMGLFIEPQAKTILVNEPFGDAFVSLLDDTGNLGPEVLVKQKIGNDFYDLGNGVEVLQRAWKTLQYGIGTDGNLYLMRGPDTVLSIPADGKLGLFFETDSILGGTLHKHGPAELVQEQFNKHRQAFRYAGLYDKANALQLVEIPVAVLTPPIIAELNACLSISGRIGRITDHLNTFH
ncbi:hypothetical protein [Microvirga sesbaniae]|nr:hypothetical protein [Microvirga sp. HBU67692]